MNCDEKWSCAQPRRSSTRRLCVRHLPHERQPQPSSAHARRSSTRRLCVLRLPNERQPRPSGAHAQRPRAPQLDQEALCTAPSARKAASVHRPCHTKGSRGPAAPTRAAARPGGSLYCACHSSTEVMFSGRGAMSQ